MKDLTTAEQVLEWARGRYPEYRAFEPSDAQTTRLTDDTATAAYIAECVRFVEHFNTPKPEGTLIDNCRILENEQLRQEFDEEWASAPGYYRDSHYSGMYDAVIMRNFRHAMEEKP